jgi:hypothetical protein
MESSVGIGAVLRTQSGGKITINYDMENGQWNYTSWNDNIQDGIEFHMNQNELLSLTKLLAVLVDKVCLDFILSDQNKRG